MRRAFLSIAAGLLAILAATESRAGATPGFPSDYPSVPTGGKKIVFIDGQISPGDFRIFLEVVNSVQPDIVVLDSPGGVLDEGLLIAAEIRRRGLNTFIYGNRMCASACAMMFLSGATKYAKLGASIGLHSSSYIDGSLSAEGTAEMARYLVEIGTPMSLISRMASTAPYDMHWLTDSEMRAMDVRVITPGSQKVRRPRELTMSRDGRIVD